MSKSVLSQSTQLKSGSALALGALMTKGSGTKRTKSGDRGADVKSVAPGVSKAAPPPTLPGQAKPKPAKVDTEALMAEEEDESTASTQPAPSGGSSRCYGSMVTMNGEDALAPPSPVVSKAEVQPWLSAGKPTLAEGSSRNSMHSNMVECVASMIRQADDEAYYAAGGSQYAGISSKMPTWACCATNPIINQADLSRRPGGAGIPKLSAVEQHQEQTLMQRYFGGMGEPFSVATGHCTSCSSALGADIFIA